MERNQGSYPEQKFEPQEERQLLLRAKDGDMEAFGQLAQAHEAVVFKKIHNLVNHHETAEDLTQQTWVRALGAIDRFEHRGAPIVSWFLRIAHNLSLDHISKKNPNVPISDEMLRSFPDDSRGYPEITAIRKEDFNVLHEALSSLVFNQESVIRKHYFQDKSIDEIAEEKGKNNQAIRSDLFRARDNLRKKLRSHFSEGAA